MQAAAELRLADLLADGLNDPDELAAIAGVRADGLRRLLLADFAELFAHAGFRLTRVVRTPSPFRIAEGVPA